MSNAVFKEIPEPIDVLREITRVLKPGGWIIVTEFRYTRIIGVMMKSVFKAHGPYTINELKNLFIKAGLSHIKVSSVRRWVMGIGKKLNMTGRLSDNYI